ncbi:MAG: TIGR02206 family membrane protein [Actinomycetota bacterium]|nr:TIGR02206 family membrane protein [Actinomycetota bacterium]
MLALTAASGTLAVLVSRRHETARLVVVSRALAIGILGSYVVEHLAFAARGTWTLDRNLPLHLTDAVTLVCVAALWIPHPLLIELLYFWALSASLQAVLTPDPGAGFPSIFFVTYFVTHCGAIVAACFLVFGRRLLPRRGAVWRVFGITAGFAALAALGNVVTGGNYMFLREKPDQASVLDVMGPWPAYIVSGAVLGLLMFLALAAVVAVVRTRVCDAWVGGAI